MAWHGTTVVTTRHNMHAPISVLQLPSSYMSGAGQGQGLGHGQGQGLTLTCYAARVLAGSACTTASTLCLRAARR